MKEIQILRHNKQQTGEKLSGEGKLSERDGESMRLWSSVKDQLLCFPGDTVMKNLPADTADARDTVRSLGQEDPLQGETAAHSSILA